MHPWLAVLLAAVAIWAARVAQLFLRGRSARPSGSAPVRLMAVLGSGGHTAEMLALLKGLEPRVYTPRDYVIADTDHTSAQRIETFETARGADASAFSLLRLPRSREVGQSYVSSVFTTLYALLHAFGMVLRARPSLLLCNGPGTCIPVCAWAYALRLLGLKHVTIVYVESIARVDSVRRRAHHHTRRARRGARSLPRARRSHPPLSREHGCTMYVCRPTALALGQDPAARGGPVSGAVAAAGGAAPKGEVHWARVLRGAPCIGHCAQ